MSDITTDPLAPVLGPTTCADTCPLTKNCIRGADTNFQDCIDEARKVEAEIKGLEGVDYRFQAGNAQGINLWIKEDGKEGLSRIIFSNGERVRG